MKVQKVPAQIGQIGYVRIEEKGHVTGWTTRRPRSDADAADANAELDQVAAFMLETFAAEIDELELWLEEIREPGVVLLGEAQDEWITMPLAAATNERASILARLAKWLKTWRAGYAR